VGASFTRSAATHKATKLALTQLTDSLAEELQQAGELLSLLLLSQISHCYLEFWHIKFLLAPKYTVQGLFCNTTVVIVVTVLL